METTTELVWQAPLQPTTNEQPISASQLHYTNLWVIDVTLRYSQRRGHICREIEDVNLAVAHRMPGWRQWGLQNVDPKKHMYKHFCGYSWLCMS